nr:unnamed protein product [Callosobruchus analis]
MQEIKNSAISELDFTLSSLNSDFLRKVLYLRWQFAVTANLGYEFRVTPTTFSFANIATMAVRVAVIIYLLALAYSVCEAAFPAGLRSQLPIQLNSIEDIKFSCDVNRFNITLKMRQPFKGLLFAKDFSQECRMLGRASSSSESEDPSNKSTRSSSSSDIGEDISPQHQQPGQEIAIPIEILGTNLLQSAAVGPEIHAEIASRWTPFCRAGLDKDDRKSFMEKYPSPSNVEGLSPPVLNAEISACLTENLLRRDTFLSTLQRQITAAMSAIALPMNVFFSNPSEETNVHLHHLANGLKLLADVMHSLSRHRRYGLSNTMNNNKEGFQADQIQSAKKGGGEQKEPEIKKKLEEVGVPKLVEKSVPESGIDAILCSVNDRTHRQYDYVLRKWWSYCTRHLLDPFSYNLQAVISFLAEVYKSGNSYSSVNTHKSALAMIITFKEEDQCIIKRV